MTNWKTNILTIINREMGKLITKNVTYIAKNITVKVNLILDTHSIQYTQEAFYMSNSFKQS